jgi:hypothetical protein
MPQSIEVSVSIASPSYIICKTTTLYPLLQQQFSWRVLNPYITGYDVCARACSRADPAPPRRASCRRRRTWTERVHTRPAQEVGAEAGRSLAAQPCSRTGTRPPCQPHHPSSQGAHTRLPESNQRPAKERRPRPIVVQRPWGAARDEGGGAS